MGTWSSRRDRLAPTLTGKERAVLMIRARNTGSEPDPEWSRVPQDQRLEFNRYVTLDYVASHQLNGFIHAVANFARHLEDDFERLDFLDWAAAELENQLDEKLDPRTLRNWRKQTNFSVPFFMRGLSEEVRVSLLKDAEVWWQYLRAVETVEAEIAAEFDGEDPLVPELQEKLASTRQALNSLFERLDTRKKKVRPEPTQEMIDQTRREVDHAFEKLGLVDHG